MNLLSDNERTRLLEVLKDAPDDILFSAAHATWAKQQAAPARHIPHVVETGVSRDAPTAVKSLAQLEAEEAANPPVNKPVQVPPGGDVTRVGGDVKAVIMSTCKTPSSAETINKALKRGPAALDGTLATLKLLWTRGDLHFEDGLYSVKS